QPADVQAEAPVRVTTGHPGPRGGVGVRGVEALQVDAALPDADVADALRLQLLARGFRGGQVDLGLLVRLANDGPDRPFGEAQVVEVRVAGDVRVVGADERQAAGPRVEDAGPAEQERAHRVDQVRSEPVEQLDDPG